jgi:glycerate-2-kinase
MARRVIDVHAAPRQVAEKAYARAIAAADPEPLVRHALADVALDPAWRDLTIVAIGKAAARMARGAEEALGDRIASRFVVTKDDAGHPVPDERSLRAGRELIVRVAAAERVVALISGGASALACVPAPGLSFDDKIAALRAVAAAGAPIHELNAVRKHLSAIKGGRLALSLRGPCAALLLSDVIGDDPSTIGGGLFAPDPTTYADALAIVDRRGVAIPAAARAHLESGPPETPKPGDPRLAADRVDLRVIGGPDLLVDGAIDALRAGGVDVVLIERGVTTSVEELAERLASIASELAARDRGGAAVLGGEPTIRIDHPSPGRGGRAQHAALLAALALGRRQFPEDAGVAILCGASDGTDGPTSDAGGLVDPGTIARAALAGHDVDDAVARFDSAPVLAAADSLLTTGPTGTNVCDLFLVVVTRAG